MINPLIIEFIKDRYSDELYEAWHNSHTVCGQHFCLDAGGNLIVEDDYDLPEIKNELALDYYNENKDKVAAKYKKEVKNESKRKRRANAIWNNFKWRNKRNNTGGN